MSFNYEIRPFKGLGELNFGMAAGEVQALLGPAEEVEEIEDGAENKTIIWHYWSMGISLFFNENNDLTLSSIETDNSLSSLWGKFIFRMNEKQLIELFTEQGFSQIDIEEEEWGEKRVSFDDALTDLYFEEGELTSISWGQIFDDFEISLWPN
jgi:hypothetical protein